MAIRSLIPWIALLALPGANAWFRLPCTTPLVSERLDPIISPGVNPSQHAHTVHGASNFAANSTYDTLRASSCTSCTVTQDLSNYWFPKLYFQDPVTKMFEDVPNGGLLVYYLQRGDEDVSNGGPGLKAFPAGFKMIAGNPMWRAQPPTTNASDPQAALQAQAMQHVCLRYSANLPGTSTAGFPTTNCESGLNARVQFPSCWDGVNLDSADHMSHTAYLSGLDNGACPDTHPVGLMKMLFEVTWDVNHFADRWDPSTQAWPFVYSTGDPTGFSLHGDFQSGWDVDVLQNAIDHCNNPNDDTGAGVVTACSYLNVQDSSVATQCKISPVVNEVISGNLTRLPGCNPVQDGPGNAKMYSDASCPAGEDSSDSGSEPATSVASSSVSATKASSTTSIVVSVSDSSLSATPVSTSTSGSSKVSISSGAVSTSAASTHESSALASSASSSAASVKTSSSSADTGSDPASFVVVESSPSASASASSAWATPSANGSEHLNPSYDGWSHKKGPVPQHAHRRHHRRLGHNTY